MLAGLLAIVAVFAAWLSNCIPGFGFGSNGEGEGEGEQAAESERAKPAEAEPETEPEPAKPGEPSKPDGLGAAADSDTSERKPVPVKLTIDARGCIFDGGEPIDCATMCDDDKLFEGADSVIIDAKNGPHGVVMDVLDCLKARGLAVAINRK